MINVEVHKDEGESTLNLIRRFSRRVTGAGVIQGMRNRRYRTRAQSDLVRRKHTLKSIARREEVRELIKLGKMIEQTGPRKGKGGPKKK